MTKPSSVGLAALALGLTLACAGLLPATAGGPRVVVEGTELRLCDGAGEAKLAAFMQHAPVGMYLKDLDGRCTMLNPEMEKVLGRPAEAMPGRRAAEVFGGRDARDGRGDPAADPARDPPGARPLGPAAHRRPRERRVRPGGRGGGGRAAGEADRPRRPAARGPRPARLGAPHCWSTTWSRAGRSCARPRTGPRCGPASPPSGSIS